MGGVKRRGAFASGAVIAVVLLAQVLTGCSTAAAIALPPTTGGFDYQLGGAYDADVAVVVRDASAAPLPGAYSVCYVNGFQTQPGDAVLWRGHPELLLTDSAGEPMVDPDWPDEFVLNPSTAAQREGILEVIGPVIAHCAAAGFNAVEIDNIDTFARFPAIEEDGALELARSYAELAHAANLAIAQKNAAEIAPRAHAEIGFDFAISESCGAYFECAAYTDVYGEHVLQIEYAEELDNAGLRFEDVCGDPDRAPQTILRDRDLVARGQSGHLYRTC